MRVHLIPAAFLFMIAACSSAPTSKEPESKPVNLYKDEILQALLSRKDDFRECYERELNRPNADVKDGLLKMEWTINYKGNVTQALVLITELNNPPIENCVLSTLRTTRFPRMEKPTDTVIVSFPFKFYQEGGHNASNDSSPGNNATSNKKVRSSLSFAP